MAYIGHTHVTAAERAALAALEAVGLHDVVRERWPGERVFSYWDYRAGMFHQDLGMRINLVRAAWIDRQARKGSGPSDHAPVIVDPDEAPDADIGLVVPPPSGTGPTRQASPVPLNGGGPRGEGRPVSPAARALSAGPAREAGRLPSAHQARHPGAGIGANDD